ncbi:MAG: hypothetical protein IPJ89_00620 [Candidatus Iainarchaeum archaeon]|uniref:DUF4399 domain-containing protein n=1 Tax=Candidatus Iainarchaeum sp. TaxID=3101447 RepID=A0A7T9DK14_9ARCH|nr:MAG: hypothetical protein IPJ89_00620 [Candidatus Diapherotrites archaeon]
MRWIIALLILSSLALCVQAHEVVTNDTAHDTAHLDLYNIPAGETIPSIRMEVELDHDAGWNVHLITNDFAFAPEHVGQAHLPGEGHVHLYVDGEKIARVYGEWYHLQELPGGNHYLSAVLTTNDHKLYAVEGQTIQAGLVVNVPETYDDSPTGKAKEQTQHYAEQSILPIGFILVLLIIGFAMGIYLSSHEK